MDNEKMAQFISKMRNDNKLTQKELAEQLGVTDKAVSKWERGLSCPDISLLSKLSQVLGVTISELLNGQKAEQGAPEVNAVVEATLQYADSATKSAAKKNARWKHIAIVSVLCLLGVLIIFGCRWAIDDGLGWSILPANIVAVIWLAVMFGVFIMGKNKIASLLLCGFIIFITTYYYSLLNTPSRDISAYGEFNGFTRAYIPHYTIIIIMLIVSIALAVISFLIQKKRVSGDNLFLLVTTSATFLILPVLTVPSIMDYVDINGLGVNPTFTILLLLTFLMNLVSLAMLAKRYKKRKDKTTSYDQAQYPGLGAWFNLKK